ncbi:hypothetical protein ABEB36_011273 [Hypothenemus hampei]|uniref:Uncharacterized protein n=1 Tax=Hypothenemus hampei TaxID=57062 RepID=A0ABD1EET6_HYPHA
MYMKLHCSIIITLLVTSSSYCDETTQQYLESAVHSLKNLRSYRGEVSPLRKPRINRRSQQYPDEAVPPLALTKGELSAMYEQAISKGETIKLSTGDNEYVNALVHHIDDEPSEKHQGEPQHEHQNEDSGYYYYYYPIKSFIDDISSQPSEEHSPNYHDAPHHHHKEHSTYKPPFTYHSHHHQHNITIQTKDHEKKDAKHMEHPLIMAISGFIGMAMMFVLSMVVLPKLGSTKPKVNNEIKKKDQLDDFARLALNAIEGNCAERFACELTKTARSFDLEDNRFYKLLQRVAPGTFGRYIKHSGKYANKQLQCTAIPCRRKKPNSNNIQNKKPPNNKKKNGNKNI